MRTEKMHDLPSNWILYTFLVCQHKRIENGFQKSIFQFARNFSCDLVTKLQSLK